MRIGPPTVGLTSGILRGPCVPRDSRAFTLAELMVVIAIIAILASIGLPALRGLGESTSIDAAARQMLDDLAYARQRAINDRTTVYMLFVPPGDRSDALRSMPTNLFPLRSAGYTLYSRRTVGEQPGRFSPRQLIEWRSLPDKTLFPPEMFFGSTATNTFNRAVAWTPSSWWDRTDEPTAGEVQLNVTNRIYGSLSLPYIAFNSQGQLVRFDDNGRLLPRADEFVALTKGSVFHPQNASGQYTGTPDIVEMPVGNRLYIRINWLTGRALVLGDAHRLPDGTIVIQGQPQ